MDLELEKFNKKKHDRSQFDCGEPVLNHFLHKQVSQDAKRNYNRCYVLFDQSTNRVIGYFTLSAHSAESDPQSGPYSQIPAVLIGRLAVCKTFQKQGYARELVIQALIKSIALHQEIGINVVIVDPLDQDVVGLYEKLGFEETQSGQLWLSIQVAKKAMKAAGRL